MLYARDDRLSRVRGCRDEHRLAPGSCSGSRTATAATFPGELRQFVGARSGVLIAQQMAANLGVGVGDRVSIGRAGHARRPVRVDGIVDFTAPQQLLLPPAAATAASQAPVPDNVLIVPAARWQTLFGDARAHAIPSSSAARCTRISTRGALPRDPSAAYTRALGLAKNLETRTAGDRHRRQQPRDRTRRGAWRQPLRARRVPLPRTARGAARGAPDRRDRRRRAPIGAAATRRSCAPAARRPPCSRASPSPSRCSSALVGGAVGLAAAAVIGAAAFGSSRFGATAGASAAWAGDLGARSASPSRARNRPARVARCPQPHRGPRARHRAPHGWPMVGRLRTRPAGDRRRDPRVPRDERRRRAARARRRGQHAGVRELLVVPGADARLDRRRAALVPARRARPAARAARDRAGLAARLGRARRAPSRRAWRSSARRSRARSR